jgi:hypothetical protein
MNTGLFKSLITPAFERNLPGNINVFADIMAMAYSAATIGSSKTLYGATLIHADKNFVKNATFVAMSKNFIDKSFSTLTQNYKIMALGFIQYWTTAKFDLRAPLPITTVIPPQGTTITIPGQLEPFSTMLRLAFATGDAKRTADMLCSAFFTLHSTIVGVVTGNTSTGYPVPVPIPWTGII